jgi:tetratricopeptide (TPR) repeat protein
MHRRKRSYKTWFLPLVILLAVTVLFGCSSLRNFFGLVSLSDSEKIDQYQNNSLKQFLANIRPQQGNAESHFLLAKYYQERNRHKEAIGEFTKTLSIDPNHTLALNGLGISYDLLGDYPKAIEAYQAALQINPNLEYTYNNLGYSYLMQGNYDQAIESFKKALAMNNKNEIYRNNLGLAYFKKGEKSLAWNELKANEASEKAHAIMGDMLYREGQYEKAKEEYKTALKINPEMPQVERKIAAAENLAKITEARNAASNGNKVVLKIDSSDSKSLNAQSVGIEVSNGNGVTRMARGVADYLKENNLKVVRLTNARSFSYTNSQLLCEKEYLSTAQEVTRMMPAPVQIQEVKKLDRPTVKVKLIIGKDLMTHKKELGIDRRS